LVETALYQVDADALDETAEELDETVDPVEVLDETVELVEVREETVDVVDADMDVLRDLIKVGC
jgi:hypothetical protein